MDIWSLITMMIGMRKRKANKCVVSGRLYSADGCGVALADAGVRSIHACRRSKTGGTSGSHIREDRRRWKLGCCTRSHGTWRQGTDEF